MTLACQHCGVHYGELLRGELWHAYACRTCRRESCDRCVSRVDQGNHIAFLSCPKCSGDSLQDLDLRERHSIFTPVADLHTYDRCIALPFVTRSVYPRRTENLLRSALPKLEKFRVRTVLLNESDQFERQKLVDWFPTRFDQHTAGGSGALIWITDGVAVRCGGGPYLTEYEILKTSRELWAE